MFEEIDDFNTDIESILQTIDTNSANAKELTERLAKIKNRLNNYTKISVEPDSFEDFVNTTDRNISFENEVLFYIQNYREINSTNLDELPTILPSEIDYHYSEILLRLCAESLKEIKNCEELKIEENIEKDPEIDTIIKTEKQKMAYIKSLLEPTKDLIADDTITNKIILTPNLNDNISILKDIEHIPLEYYGEVATLLESIINNTFKRFKRLYTIFEINGFCEVRGKKIRIIFKRLNNDTYALITIFMKKTTSDNGYRDFIRGKISNYITVANSLKNNLDNPEFLKLNDFYLKELFNKLGMNTKRKEAVK